MEQVTAINQDQAVANNPLILLTQPNSAAWEDFTVSHSNNTFRIDAKKADSAVHSLVLVFENEQLSSMSMHDIQLNNTISDSIFSFSLPQGYDLDDQRN